MKKAITLSILLILTSHFVFSQTNARNGCYYPPIGELRLFIVFADAVNDTSTALTQNWNAGELPGYADEIIDEDFDDIASSYASRFFQE